MTDESKLIRPWATTRPAIPKRFGDSDHHPFAVAYGCLWLGGRKAVSRTANRINKLWHRRHGFDRHAFRQCQWPQLFGGELSGSAFEPAHRRQVLSPPKRRV